jgi:hypothetical protein
MARIVVKSWYKSKTVWFNVAALLSVAISRSIALVIQPYVEAFIIGVMNIILRFFTRQAIE